MEQYIYKKHGLCKAKLNDINTNGLHAYTKKAKPHQRASMSKLIHKWIPTNSFLHKQGRAPSPTCPRCNSIEDADHILSCARQSECDSWSNHTYLALTEIHKMTSSPVFMHTFELLLTTHLHIKSKQLIRFERLRGIHIIICTWVQYQIRTLTL